ncbi:MAG: hypothetical protein ACI39R_01305 [Lachnospiraceae bacterium]
MGPVLTVILIILAVILVALVVLYFVGRHLQKKQEATMPDVRANAQSVSMLVIDKKHLKLKEAGFPQVVMEQTPKYMRGAKVPVVKAKVGPRIMNLMCDEKIFDDIPLKKEVKALVNGIYIIEVKGLRASAKPAEEPKKKGFFKRAKKEAAKMADEKAKKKNKK